MSSAERLSHVCRFAGLADDPAVRKAWTERSDESNVDKWRAVLTPAETGRITYLMRPELQRYMATRSHSGTEQGTVPRIGWMSFHAEGLTALEAVLQAGHPVAAVITLRSDLAAKRSASVDFRPLCRRCGIPLHEIGNVNDAESLALLDTLHLDLLFVIGWSQILRSEALRRARVGVIGAHASLLPRYRGSAPINWALIQDRKETGNSLIWLTAYVDGGADRSGRDPDHRYDSCATLYERVALSNSEMILRVLPSLGRGESRSRTGPRRTRLPRRRPDDGRMDWRRARDVV